MKPFVIELDAPQEHWEELHRALERASRDTEREGQQPTRPDEAELRAAGLALLHGVWWTGP